MHPHAVNIQLMATRDSGTPILLSPDINLVCVGKSYYSLWQGQRLGYIMSCFNILIERIVERLTDLHPGADYMCLALQMIYLGTLCKIPVSNGQIAPTCKIGTRTYVLPLVVLHNLY